MGKLDMLMTGPGSSRKLFGAEVAPRIVEERPGRVGNAPIRHRTTRIVREAARETLDRLLMVETEAPIQAEVEPLLSLGRRRCYLAAVITKVESIHCCTIDGRRTAGNLCAGDESWVAALGTLDFAWLKLQVQAPI